jgi:biotin transporter BioY
VAVAASGPLLGASWVSDAGEARVAVVTRGAPVVAQLGPGARVAIAPAADGFFATWSAVGAIHGAFVDPSGTITSTPVEHYVGQDAAAHALVALPDALVLAADTTSPTAPIDVAIIGCL